MDWPGIYSFLFESYAGMAILFGITIVICLIACIIMEYHTRRKFKNHNTSHDEWSMFDDDEKDDD